MNRLGNVIHKTPTPPTPSLRQKKAGGGEDVQPYFLEKANLSDKDRKFLKKYIEESDRNPESLNTPAQLTKHSCKKGSDNTKSRPYPPLQRGMNKS